MKKLQVPFVLLAFSILFLLFHYGVQKDREKEHSSTDSSLVEKAKESEDLEAIRNEQYSGMPFAELVQEVLQDFSVEEGQVAIGYYNFQEDTDFYLNENRVMYAASTTKVAIAALFTDLIHQGEETWETELPYSDNDYEEGEGNITNSEKQSSYPIADLVQEMLIYSDNTATNILSNYYIDQYAGSYQGFREAIASLSGLEDLDPEIYEENYATAKMLEQTLIRIAANQQYAAVVETMQEAQSGFRFKEYVPEGMAAKYGSAEEWHHDTGIFYEEDQPIYVLVVMTENVDQADEFLAVMNLHVNEWTRQQG